jgi:uncharacterized protein YeeX (DUF496 family)
MQKIKADHSGTSKLSQLKQQEEDEVKKTRPNYILLQELQNEITELQKLDENTKKILTVAGDIYEDCNNRVKEHIYWNQRQDKSEEEIDKLSHEYSIRMSKKEITFDGKPIQRGCGVLTMLDAWNYFIRFKRQINGHSLNCYVCGSSEFMDRKLIRKGLLRRRPDGQMPPREEILPCCTKCGFFKFND